MDLAWRNSAPFTARLRAPAPGQLAPLDGHRILRGSCGLRGVSPLRAPAGTSARRGIRVRPSRRAGRRTRAEAGNATEKAEAEASGAWREAARVGEEIRACYEVVERMGRGFVFLGSSRIAEDHPFFRQSLALSREIAVQFSSTTWSGIGPGLMDAVALGAEAVNRPVAGFKIVSEARQAEAAFVHPRLPAHAYVTCRSVLARKQGFLMAGSRSTEAHVAGFIALPGGVGTLDEILDFLALRQLGVGAGAPGEGSLGVSSSPGSSRKRSQGLPVPFLLMDYEGCYQPLLACMEEMQRWGLVDEREVESLWHVCRSNDEALHFLRKFYS
ncbi:hypothetical protein CLOM_g24137 [Closterium sp. NIES-68]|nr:hypothetical protein CLOM_g24137 [Closterium sp. NIES-68]GJP84667.1 hypothetical protein CLOP_g14711 [Closterium sp. NIES-67]